MPESNAPEASLPEGWPRRLPGICFVCMMSVGGAFAVEASLSAPNDGVFLSGEWAEHFEDHLDAEIGFRDEAITAWGIAEYTLFGQGRPGVVVGEDGWLYTSEEFEVARDAEAAQAFKLELASAVKDYLAQRGVELQVAVIPSKARVYPEPLAGVRVPQALQQRYDDFVDALQRRGIKTVGLLPALAAEDSGAAAFLRTDTHWTPAGAAAAARAIASAVTTPLPRTEWEQHLEAAVPHRGDLLRYLPLGPLQDWGPSPDSLATPVVTQVGGGGLGLFDEVVVPVALVGTSYSADARWGFQASLRQALHADVLDAADPGGGPVEPLLDYLENDAFRQTPPKLVIWEVPERYVSVSYDISEHKALLAELGLGGEG